MTNLGKNIKKIRAIKKISQAGFGEIFGLSRASIGAYEEGRAEAKLEVIINIANYFSITVDDLINKELTVNELYHFNIFDEKLDPMSEKEDELLKKLAISNIPIVSSADILNKDISDCMINTQYSISLPSINENSLAILINRKNFKHITKNISNNDIIITTLNFNLWKEVDFENKTWLINSQNQLFIGNAKSIKGFMVFFPDGDLPVNIPHSEIKFILPIDTHVAYNSNFTSNEPDYIKNLELKINDLYKRL